MAIDKIENKSLADTSVTADKLSNTLDISSKTVTLPAASVTAHVNLTPVRQDILTLALKQAVQENSTKFNLPNSAITKFEADADFNLAGSTTVARNASEYISSVSSSTDTDLAELFLFDESFTDFTGNSSVGERGLLEIVEGGNQAQTIVTEANSVTGSTKSAAASGWSATSTSGGFQIQTVSGQTAPLDFGTGAFTIEGWFKLFNTSGPANHAYVLDWSPGGGVNRLTIAAYVGYSPPAWNGSFCSNGGWDWNDFSTSAYTHWAYVRDASGNHAIFIDGARVATATGSSVDLDFSLAADDNAADSGMGVGERWNHEHSAYGKHSSFRISTVARYDPTASTCTVPTSEFSATTDAVSATGTALGTTNVPTSAVTDVSGVMLLKDAYGSTTLGTDVKAYFTADNSNWTEATSYADAGTFSTGIKMIKLGKATCTEGSDVRWKIVWANQVDSSKEAQIYGIGLNY